MFVSLQEKAAYAKSHRAQWHFPRQQANETDLLVSMLYRPISRVITYGADIKLH